MGQGRPGGMTRRDSTSQQRGNGSQQVQVKQVRHVETERK